eukprot:Amastigsp_a682244_9.p3 type:complete len:116 gc:universal Amastigsp_a682244_9:312-659(+)
MSRAAFSTPLTRARSSRWSNIWSHVPGIIALNPRRNAEVCAWTATFSRWLATRKTYCAQFAAVTATLEPPGTSSTTPAAPNSELAAIAKVSESSAKSPLYDRSHLRCLCSSGSSA